MVVDGTTVMPCILDKEELQSYIKIIFMILTLNYLQTVKQMTLVSRLFKLSIQLSLLWIFKNLQTSPCA
jgi:hypothetical protein